MDNNTFCCPEKIHIKDPCSSIRAEARENLAGLWKPAMAITLVYLLLIEVAGQIPVIGTIWLIVAEGALTLGISKIFIAYHDKEATESIFSGFKQFGKTMGLFWFTTLFIALWSLLFIIPGIIASIRYSQAFYILAEHPEYKIRQCVNLSKDKMDGNIMKYFCLMLSFIGWVLLAFIGMVGIAFVIGQIIGIAEYIPLESGIEQESTAYYLATLSENNMLTILIYAAETVLLTPVACYVTMAETVFYKKLFNKEDL